MSQTADHPETRHDEQIPSLLHPSGLNPLDYPVCLQRPKRHGVPTAWTGHVPFAMCLVAMAKPRVFVELGTQWGVSYSAFCQAVKALRLGTRCYAVDTWMGCPHSGSFGAADLADLKRHNDAEYALFSELVQSTFDDALTRFQVGSIDILHIDGFHSYDAVRHDFETWLPKMSERGVVLFHDTEIRWSESYGVWRFWDEVKQGYPHFEFHHGYGLGVLAVGKTIPAGLRPLIDLREAETDRVREYFASLGERLVEIFDISSRYQELQAKLLEKADESVQAQVQLLAKAEECDRAQALVVAKADACDQQADELAAARRLLDQFRFRAVDEVANRIGRFPRLYRILRSLAKAAAGAAGRNHSLGSTVVVPPPQGG